MVGVHFLAAAPLMTTGDAAAQCASAAYIRVMGVTGQQAIDGGVNDGQRRVEIRIADRQQQHIDALLAQFQRSIVNLPGCRSVTGDSLGQG
ncbi:hypothetical protein D3C85_1725530 [compost metagenome]